jgi:serine/threonine-protein kinase RsbW
MTHSAAESQKPEGKIELRIPASADWVRVARLTVAGVASRLPFGVVEIEDIKLAVAEAVNNAIQHSLAGDLPSSRGEVTITMQVTREGLTVEVTDQGRVPQGFAPRQPPAWSGEEELPESGLGLLLIRSLMDEVTITAGENTDTSVRMFKSVPGSATS